MNEQELNVIDFLINTLQEHEKVLDGIIKRLEVITPTLEKEMMK